MENLYEVLKSMQIQACLSDSELERCLEDSGVTFSAYNSWKNGAYVPNQRKLLCVTNLLVDEAKKYDRDISEYALLAERMRREKRI